MPPNPRVHDFTTPRATGPVVDVELHGATDLLISLWLLDDNEEIGRPLDEYGLGEAWFFDYAASLSPATRERIERIGSGNVWIGAMAALDDLPNGSTVDDYIERVATMDPVALRRHLVIQKGENDERLIELGRSAAEGNAEALETLLAEPMFADQKRWSDSIRLLFEVSPATTQDLIATTLRAAQSEAFAEREREFRPILERDLAAKQAMAQRLSTERFVELATNGISIESQGYQRPILLIPSIVGRPWIFFTETDEHLVMAYPVADEYMGADPDAPPQWLVKTYKALGDERRLRILRRLSRGPAALHELATELDVSKSTLHHHMMLLRTAGLVKVQIGHDKEYALREDIVPETTAVLQSYIEDSGGN